MEEEDRLMGEHNRQPRWVLGCYKERKDKEDTGKDGEEDQDGEGTLS